MQFHRLENSAKSTVTQCVWASGQKPPTDHIGTRIPCKTENFVPVVVPGLSSSSGASSSSTPTRSVQKSPNQLKKKTRTTNKQRETACEASGSGQKSSQKILKTQKCLQPHTFLMTQLQNIQRKRHSQKTEIANSASETR